MPKTEHELHHYIPGTIPRSSLEREEATEFYNGYVPGTEPTKASHMFEATRCAIDSLQFIRKHIYHEDCLLIKPLDEFIAEAKKLNGKLNPRSRDAEILLTFTTSASAFFNNNTGRCVEYSIHAAPQLLNDIKREITIPSRLKKLFTTLVILTGLTAICVAAAAGLPITAAVVTGAIGTALVIAGGLLLKRTCRLDNFSAKCRLFATQLRRREYDKTARMFDHHLFSTTTGHYTMALKYACNGGDENKVNISARIKNRKF